VEKTALSMALLAGIAAFGFTGGAAASESDPWLVRAGASIVDPQHDNGTLDLGRAVEALPSTDISVDNATSFTFTVSYFFNENVAVELLAAYPFSHDFKLTNVNVDGKVDHLPPTLSLQWHFPFGDRWKPYVGAGINWTMFSNAHVDAPVNVSLDDSIGLALQTGIDIALTEKWLLNFDVRYIHITSDAHVNGVNVGTVDINPMVYGVNVGYRF
jgi:outer membrane protein